MEKLPVTFKNSIFIFVLFFCTLCFAQKELVVFKPYGKPTLKLNDSLKPIHKGTILHKKHKLLLHENDSILLIDARGKTFGVNKKGSYTFNEILNNPLATENASFTKKYFSYIWKQFTNKETKKPQVGVVFRSGNLVLLKPSDSVKLFTSEIKFTWSGNNEASYFYLKNLKTNHIIKFGVSGNFVLLFVDQVILKAGNQYQWAISNEKFPNLNDLEFYNFELLSQEEFNNLKPSIEAFNENMKSLGFTASEVKAFLCNDYKICF